MKESSGLHPSELGLKATLMGIIINLMLAVIKAAAGFLGNSYALIADAVESVTDIFSSLIVFWGLKISARPADADHPLGHGKAEPLAALAVGSFLIFAAGMIAYQSVAEVLHPHTLPAPWTLIVLVGIVALKLLLSKFAHGIADAIGSSAVKSDAWHHQSDALTSAAAFIGISVAILGNHFHPEINWSSADDWAALFSSFIIAYNGISIIKTTINELMDAHPGLEIEHKIRDAAKSVEGVENLHKCFIRKMGFDYYVELDVRVSESLNIREGHRIAHEVQDTVRSTLPHIRFGRVTVHIEPA